MKTTALYQTLMATLRPVYDETEARSIALLVLEKCFGIRQTDVYMDKDTAFPTNKVTDFQNICSRLSHGEPVQHIIGTADFGGISFMVNADVLIPRPETLTVIEQAMPLIEKVEHPRILDVGTGSGCLAVTIQHRLRNKADVTAWDISAGALQVARKNAENNGVTVRFLQVDVLEACKNSQSERYHVILSNPPYIRQSEKTAMHRNVLDFEPHLALFVSDEQPLVFYHALAMLGKNSLVRGGSIVCEINEFLHDETADLFRNYGYHCRKILDEMGKNRVIVATLPDEG